MNSNDWTSKRLWLISGFYESVVDDYCFKQTFYITSFQNFPFVSRLQQWRDLYNCSRACSCHMKWLNLSSLRTSLNKKLYLKFLELILFHTFILTSYCGVQNFFQNCIKLTRFNLITIETVKNCNRNMFFGLKLYQCVV